MNLDKIDINSVQYNYFCYANVACNGLIIHTFMFIAGFKLVLRVFPYGRQFPGFVSIYLILSDSPPANWPWPFNKRVTFQVVNISGDKKVGETLNPDKRVPIERQPDGGAIDRGFPMFAKTDMLLRDFLSPDEIHNPGFILIIGIFY